MTASLPLPPRSPPFDAAPTPSLFATRLFPHPPSHCGAKPLKRLPVQRLGGGTPGPAGCRQVVEFSSLSPHSRILEPALMALQSTASTKNGSAYDKSTLPDITISVRQQFG